VKGEEKCEEEEEQRKEVGVRQQETKWNYGSMPLPYL
jgi:hypothetical protein